MADLKIAIIGGGPAGCMLARLLQLGGLTVTIFESEESPNFRSQGGTLDLHTDSGLAAMQAAGLFDEFKKHARYDGQYLAIVDKNLEYHLVRGADEQHLGEERPEIDRGKLREILSQSLLEGTIKWGHRLQRVEGHTLIFNNDITVSGFDIVVGADGAWSKIRKAICPELQPVFSGCVMHDLNIPDAKVNAPEIYNLINRGSVFAGADGQRVVLQQMGDGSIQIYAGFVRSEDDWMKPEKCGYNAEDLSDTKQALEVEFADWSPKLRQAFELAQGKPISRSLYILPVGSRWHHQRGLTLIGDAAHLMTPFAGQGVNQALEDSLWLSKAILQSKTRDELEENVTRFEESMFARATVVQQLAFDLCQLWMFTPGSPRVAATHLMEKHKKKKAALKELRRREEMKAQGLGL